jgi:hypothetical protein
MAMIDQELWNRFYKLTEEFYRLAPWKYLYETDIFGVKTRETGKKYFISIMGSLGEYFALSAYEEVTALGQYWMLHELDLVDSADVLTIPHTMLAYETLENTDQKQLIQMKAAGIGGGIDGLYPDMRRIVPGLVPETPDGKLLAEFIEILEQVIDVCKRAAKDSAFIHPDGQDDDVYLIREWTGKANAKWQDHFRKIQIKEVAFNITCKPADLDAINSLQKANVVMQAHFQLMPMPVKNNEQPPYFPSIVILTNKKNGYVEAYELLSPFPDYNTMAGNVPQRLMNFIKNLGFKPRCIEVKHHILYHMLCDTLKKCDIHIVLKNRLETVEEAIESLITSINK